MKVFRQILGNIHNDAEWKRRAAQSTVETINLDQWTAQKSRFLATGDKGNQYPVALERNTHVACGDVIFYAPLENLMVVIQVEHSQVMVIDMGQLAGADAETMIHSAVELGHALGNQHWPAVVKGFKVYVPLTVDKKVMTSVMNTHHFENITYEFLPGTEIIPYLAPHEIRRLFGGSMLDSHSHDHELHDIGLTHNYHKHLPHEYDS